MLKKEKTPPITMSEVAVSNEVTILDDNGKVIKVGKWSEWVAETEDYNGLCKRLAMFMKKNQVLIR